MRDDVQSPLVTLASIPGAIEAHASRAPDALAMVTPRGSVTYGELNARAGRLARRLRALGVEPEVLVAVHCERSVEMLVALVAIFKAGGAYLPMDPAYPVERIEYQLSSSRARVVLTQGHLAGRLPATGAAVVSIDDAGSDPGGHEAEPTIAPSPGNLAYVIYTSGSTGRPKGVAVEHRSLSRFISWHLRSARLGPDDRTTHIAGVAFDASVMDVWPSLVAGACIHVPDHETRAMPSRLAGWLAAQGITISFLPTPLLEAVLHEPLPAGIALRTLLTGGEKLHIRPPADSRFRLIDHYGPTECTVVAASMIVTPDGEGTPPIGRPVDGTLVHILDSASQPVAEGAPGELFIAGEGVARGYLDRPDLTAERFLPDPFGPPGARMYRTGDLARRSSDGILEYLGRLDDQVKIRGHRIELQEIEAVLREHPAVRGAAVLVREDRPGDKALCAYVAGTDAIAALRALAARKLPAYMVPQAFVSLPALPLTPNGKVDRRALPAPTSTLVGEAPRGALEEQIARIWSEVLGVSEIERGDGFFELGGQSLFAGQVVTRVRSDLHADISFGTLFDARNLADFAEAVGRAAARGRREALALDPGPRAGPVPLSFSQERVWFLHRMHAESLAYSFQATLRFKGDLRIDVLERALSEIVRRHEIFRTAFPSSDGQPFQRIHDPWRVEVPLIDLSTSPGDRESLALACVEREVRRPFDLEVLPLLRWTTIRLEANEHLLVHVEHHLVHDGWSWNLFLAELEQLYGSFSRGEPSPLTEPTVQFADYARWQRRWMEGEQARAQIAFWKETLAGSPPVLDLRAARPRPRVQTFRGAALRVELPRDTHRALRAFSDEADVSMFMTMLSVFLVVLRRASGRDDLCVGSAVANRGLREIEGLIGMIVNTVAIRVDLSGDPAFRDVLARVRRACLDAYAHQELPFDRVVDAVRPARSLAYAPIHQVLFSFHDTPMPAMALPGLVTSVTEGLSNGSAKFDLNVIGIPRADGGITMVWEYNADLFDVSTIEALHAELAASIAAAISDPDRRLALAPEARASPRCVATPGQTSTRRARETATGPRTPEEATIAAIWADVMGLPSVGVHDDFFSLGGHSILAARIVARVEDAFGVPVSLLAFFEQLTVARLTEAGTAARAARSEEPGAPIRLDTMDPSRLLAELDQLSDDHVEALLRELQAQELSE